jgi:phosphate:Na+ symporter
VEDISEEDDYIDAREHYIRLFPTKLSRSARTDEQAARELELIAFTSDLETIGDVVDIDLTHCRTLRIRSSYELASRHRANYHYCAFADGMLIHRQRNLAATLLQRANP